MLTALPAGTLERMIAMGRAFFALGLIGLGAAHFRFGDFVTGRAPAWPESLPGRPVWAYATGAAFVAVGASVLTRWRGRIAAIAGAALILLWALLRHIPVVAGSTFLSPEWTRAGKAAVFIGGSLAVAATLPLLRSDRPSSVLSLFNANGAFIVAGQICLALFLLITGIQHFMYVEFVASLIPGWFPGDATFWTYFAGVALIAGGAGLLVGPTARLAALLSGIMVLSWFFIVHVSREIAGIADGIAVYEALATAGILFVIAGYQYRLRARPAAA